MSHMKTLDDRHYDSMDPRDLNAMYQSLETSPRHKNKHSTLLQSPEGVSSRVRVKTDLNSP